MICAWKELLNILPTWMRSCVSEYQEAPLEEIRMRISSPPELIIARKSTWLYRSVTEEDIRFCINTASQYSPWNASTIAKGFLTAPGGHRIGICGEAIIKDDSIAGIRTPRSVCIRVARDYPGISENLFHSLCSVLILGAPGSGKTTMLRDLSRTFAQKHLVSVVDERQEIFPSGFPVGKRMDILSGCSKKQGIDIVLRTMGPECIAVDEITAEKDCEALVHASNCGVKLLATAHASGLDDYMHRRAYMPLRKAEIIHSFLILSPDKKCHLEEMH